MTKRLTFPNRVLSMLVMAMMLCVCVSAAALSDYHLRIEKASGYVDELLKYGGDGRSAFERQKTAAIKAVIPTTEKIEWPGGGIETDNKWLAADLDILAAESNIAKREDVITGVRERLLALSESVSKLESANASAHTKDDDKQRLAEILKRAEYQKPVAKDESTFQRWIREFFEWLSRVFPHPQISPNLANGSDSLKLGLQILIFVLVIALLAFLIYKFAPFFAKRLGSRVKKDKTDRVILGERVAADESPEDLFSEAEELARAGNLRGAIRKGYIAVLCELSDRKVIGLARHKTNRDYLRDVRKDQRLFENMNGLTGSFERNWYGLRPTETSDWEDFRDRYRRTIGEVKG